MLWAQFELAESKFALISSPLKPPSFQVEIKAFLLQSGPFGFWGQEGEIILEEGWGR